MSGKSETFLSDKWQTLTFDQRDTSLRIEATTSSHVLAAKAGDSLHFTCLQCTYLIMSGNKTFQSCNNYMNYFIRPNSLKMTDFT